jgi:hypothetical protein
MTRTCRFAFGTRAGAGEWTFDGEHLTLSPEDGSPISVALAEIAGIAGDGYTVDVVFPGDEPAGVGSQPAAGLAAGGASHLVLSRLGSDGPTLLEELRREWISARAEVLRLGGTGEGKRFAGRVAGLDGVGAGGAPTPGAPATGAPATGAPEPFQALLFEDVLVVAREGRDLDPLFVALSENVTLDEATYSIQVHDWPGNEVVFSKLAGQTDEFVGILRANRALMAKESAAMLAATVPGLPAGGRAALAGRWLPGRLMQVEAMESACPGFTRVFQGEWLPRLVRCEEGRYLLGRGSSSADAGSIWLGFTRGGANLGDAGVEDGAAAGAIDPATGPVTPPAEPATSPADPVTPPAKLAEGEQPLWMLNGKGGVWFLEALSVEDRATYCFRGGEELPALVSRLLCAPQFSKQALYSPLEEFTGDNAELAIPARSLRFLVELRRRFAGRIIHQTADGWRKNMERLATESG